MKHPLQTALDLVDEIETELDERWEPKSYRTAKDMTRLLHNLRAFINIGRGELSEARRGGDEEEGGR
jgi:hypothetical protein